MSTASTMSSPALPTGGYIDPSRDPISPKAALLVGPVTAFYILDLAVLALRVWSRHIKKVTWGLSDYAIFIATIFATGFVAICWLTVARGGLGYPDSQVALPQQLFVRKAMFAAWILQCSANTFVRLSILDFILHVFFPVKKFCLAVYSFEAATVAYLVAFIIAQFATCRPLKYNWEPGPDVAKYCGNHNLIFLLGSIFNLFLDIGIFILPLPMLWNLQLSARKKVGVTFVFGLGIFVIFSTIWRTYNVAEFSEPLNMLNFTEAVIPVTLWSGLEITLGIINACLPVVQPAVNRILDTPFLQRLNFFSSHSPKGSKVSMGYRNSSSRFGFRSWIRLGSSKGKIPEGKSTAFIEYQVEYSVDIEPNSAHEVPMEVWDPAHK
ncbi:hypothetical protein F4678DRAFT_57575 [Xylaria arbuscula]|nr:hypothetical protein F4678DRAFT_57575 [Xylaria arbuscula]